MSQITPEFINFLQKKAQTLRNNAAYGGSYGDGGASRLEETIDVYRAGVNGTVPNMWQEYMAEFNRENDPDYEKFLQMAERFMDPTMMSMLLRR